MSGELNNERVLALLRAAERLGRSAWRWLPYPDEAPEHALAERDADEVLIENDMALIRNALKEIEFAILNAAEDRGGRPGATAPGAGYATGAPKGGLGESE